MPRLLGRVGERAGDVDSEQNATHASRTEYDLPSLTVLHRRCCFSRAYLTRRARRGSSPLLSRHCPKAQFASSRGAYALRRRTRTLPCCCWEIDPQPSRSHQRERRRSVPELVSGRRCTPARAHSPSRAAQTSARELCTLHGERAPAHRYRAVPALVLRSDMFACPCHLVQRTQRRASRRSPCHARWAPPLAGRASCSASDSA